MRKSLILPPRGAIALVATLCAGLLVATSGWARDVVPMSEVKALQSELQANAKECRGAIMPYVGGIDAEVQAIEALRSKLNSEMNIVVPLGGQTTTVAGIPVQMMSLTEFQLFLRTLEEVGLLSRKQGRVLAARAVELTASLSLNLSAKALELRNLKSGLTTYCQETEAMLAQTTQLLNAIKQSQSVQTTGKSTASKGGATTKTPVALRAVEIRVNPAAVNQEGLTCEVGETTASCVKITGADRCSYRVWWEFPTIGELVPGAKLELEVKGSYACSYDAGLPPKRGPNWGLNVGYEYRNRTIDGKQESGLMGISWNDPKGNGLSGWTGATGCVQFLGAWGGGTTDRNVSKTCTFWVPDTFPNRRLHKGHPDHPDYQIRSHLGPTGWGAKWMIR